MSVESIESENARRELTAKINAEAAERSALEAKHGQVWNTEELARDFDVEGFMAPCVIVRRKSDRTRGTLFFQHSPRLYYSFSPA